MVFQSKHSNDIEYESGHIYNQELYILFRKFHNLGKFKNKFRKAQNISEHFGNFQMLPCDYSVASNFKSWPTTMGIQCKL